jgi:lysophospholipase L1-like esterase
MSRCAKPWPAIAALWILPWIPFSCAPQPEPEILVCLPAPAFPDKGEYQDRVIREQMIPTIRDLARALDVTVVDLYDPLSGKPHLFLDSFHPNLDGARVIAETIYSQLMD